MRAALAVLDAHYVSFIVDNDTSYAVLVTREGQLHGHAIPIGRAELRQHAQWVNPETWGTLRYGLKGERVPRDVYARLAPFVTWMAPYFAGEQSGVTITSATRLTMSCSSCRCTPCRLPTVRSLITVRSRGCITPACSARLAASKATRPKRYCTICVPAVEDLTDRRKVADLRRPVRWLASRRTGRQLAGRLAGVDEIARRDLSARIVHVAAHGIFSPDGRNLYEHSGILLPHEGEAPSRGTYFAVQLLSPARVMTLDVSGSHVTLQACVSGLMREGVGGDALGLEWALMLRDADSIISTHWTVSARESPRFSVRFYRRWLAARQPGNRMAAQLPGAQEERRLHWSSFSFLRTMAVEGRPS